MRYWSFAGRRYDCPVVLAIDRLRGRWKTNVLWLIWTGTNRFNSICQELPWVHRAAVARQLRSLERDGMVTRSVVSEKPRHVEYNLSPLGESLSPIIASLAEWGRHHGSVHEA